MIQRESLRLLLQGPVRFSRPVLAFGADPETAPPEAPRGAARARSLDGRLPVLGAVRMPKGLARGVEAEGRVVSWAVAREADEAGVRSVTVETAPGYRGRGYARACLLALRRDCRAPLLYLCESRNLHSALTALSAGFFRVGTIEKQTVREEKTMSALPFSTVDHVAIIVSDYARSRAFYVDALGFSVVREYVGHGIGRKMHESPEVPNFGAPGHGPRLLRGMTIAVEPMVNAGGAAVRVMPDGWTVRTQDGSLAAHYENTILITDGEAELLTLPEI